MPVGGAARPRCAYCNGVFATGVEPQKVDGDEVHPWCAEPHRTYVVKKSRGLAGDTQPIPAAPPKPPKGTPH